MTDDQWNEKTILETEPEAPATGVPPQYGVGPFSVREVAIVGVWLVAFVVSFFPLYGGLGAGPSIWGSGIDWVLYIGVPTAAVFLLVLRRFSPQGIRRVGSLGIDQFASVAFSVATVLWLAVAWNSVISIGSTRVWLGTWVVWVELVLMLAGVVLTVFAPLIPGLADDFRDRPETPAHRNARPVRAIAPRPAPVRPAPAPTVAPAASYAPDAAGTGPLGDEAAPHGATPESTAPETTAYDVFPTGPLAELNDTAVSVRLSGGDAAEDGTDDEWTPVHTRGTYEPAQAAAQPTAHQAFWALSPVERDVLDDRGVPIFRVGPTAWALVIEDRGSSFVVRHEDGRIGHLHDVSGVTRG